LFEGEKTVLFWVGLGILGFASTFLLFNTLWNVAYRGFRGWDVFPTLSYSVPTLAQGVIFSLIGFYMMKSGVKKREE